MTISTTSTSETYVGNGALLTFAIPFPFLAASHIVVDLIEIATGLETPQVSGTDYNVVGTNVVMVAAPSASYNLRIKRETPQTQATNFNVNQTYITTAVETAIDKLTMLIQELEDRLSAFVQGEGAGVMVAGTAQSLVASATLAITEAARQYIKVAGNGGAITLDATVGVTAGTVDGQEIRIMGTHATNTVTLPDSGNLNLNGACVLGLYDIIDLVWIDADSMWYEVSRSS